MDAADSTHRASGPGTLAFDHRFHDLLRSLDDLLDHRHPHQAGTGAQRHPVRSSGRHAHPQRIADPAPARHLDRSIWRAAGLHRRHAGRSGRDLPADLGAYISGIPGRRVVRRHRRRFVRGRDRLRFALLCGGQARHRTWHLRRRKCRRRPHQIRRALRAGSLWLADRRPGLGAGHWPDGNRVLVLLGRRSGRPCAAREEREADAAPGSSSSR